MAITAQASSCDDKMVLDEARYYMTTDKIGKEMTEVSAGAVRENAVSLMGLLQAGLLSCGKDALTVKYKDFVAVAELSSDGKIIYEGHEFKTLSAFALSAIRRVNPTRKAVDGWLSVQHKECTLNHYRQQLKCSGISASSGNDRFLPIGTDELAIKDQGQNSSYVNTARHTSERIQRQPSAPIGIFHPTKDNRKAAAALEDISLVSGDQSNIRSTTNKRADPSRRRMRLLQPSNVLDTPAPVARYSRVICRLGSTRLDEDKEVLDAKRKRVKIGGDRNHLQQPKESLGEFVSNNKVETHSAKEGGGAAKEVRQRKRAKKEGVAARSGHAKKLRKLDDGKHVVIMLLEGYMAQQHAMGLPEE
eukprot:gene12346-14583_t